MQRNSGEIRAIYELAFRMLDQERPVLTQGDELATWVQPLLEKHSPPQGHTAVDAVIKAIQRSHMFIQEDEQSSLGLPRAVIGFRHELIGKYLAACHLLLLTESSQGEASVDLVALSQEPRWFDVLCFLLDRLQGSSSPSLNPLLRAFLQRRSRPQLRLVAYALDTKLPHTIADDIPEAYLSAKVHADLYEE